MLSLKERKGENYSCDNAQPAVEIVLFISPTYCTHILSPLQVRKKRYTDSRTMQPNEKRKMVLFLLCLKPVLIFAYILSFTVFLVGAANVYIALS